MSRATPAHRRRRRDNSGPSALALLEDAVHLLRRAPAGVWLLHFLGAGAWVTGVLFAWAHVSWFRPSRDELALGACALVVLYAWLKVAQSAFCARLMALRLGAEPGRFTWRGALRLAAAQFVPHAWGPAALLVTGALAVPFIRTWLYLQNTTILGALAKPNGARDDSRDDARDGPRGDEAWALARFWPNQAVVALLILSLLALVVFVDVAVSFYMLPRLARTLLGMDNFMALGGWSMLNTTFLMSVYGITWFLVDPLAKAFCVLRVFHGRALRTGADLQIEMDAARVTRRAAAGGTAHVAARATTRATTRVARATRAALLVLACALTLPSALDAATAALPPPPPAAAPQPAPESARQQQANIRPAELDRAIDEVLERRDFRWQLQPEGKKQGKEEPGAVTRFFNWLGRGLRAIAHGISSFIDWLRELFSGEDSQPGEPAVEKSARDGIGPVLLQIVLYALIAILAGLLAWVIAGAVRNRQRGHTVAAAALDTAETRPDLADENAHAAQLPSDGWLRLAREQAALGDWRLALRALYLAHLARLDSEGLITLRRHKTNLDYERELRRRALRRENMAAWFASRRREFEASWYGREQPGEARVRVWFAEVEKGAEALP
ncbi:MAG: hypothetical protein LBM04_02965 [Opitutaceae bacterium]|jgi:hypothetical protein|nr:hypothetical protein [Opitutaceae bacterium]